MHPASTTPSVAPPTSSSARSTARWAGSTAAATATRFARTAIQSKNKRPPRSPTACGSLPPEGAAGRLGAARRRPEPPRSLTACGPLPPEGAAGPLGAAPREPEGFFDRWSRRKQQVRAGEVPPEPVVRTEDEALEPAAPPGPSPSVLPAAQAPPPLTLADVQALDIDSDFKPFVAEGVAPEVKNAAFRKLFADPHFNVMDGLDTYIDDYAKPSPLPDSVLRQMASAKFLKLFEEEPEETPGNDGLPDVARSEERRVGK